MGRHPDGAAAKGLSAIHLAQGILLRSKSKNVPAVDRLDLVAQKNRTLRLLFGINGVRQDDNTGPDWRYEGVDSMRRRDQYAVYKAR